MFARAVALFLTTASVTVAFVPASASVASRVSALYAYVPDGMTASEYAALKKKESNAGKNLGSNGPRGYRSRSFESFQKALEAGDPKAKNMPVFFAKEKLARGEIKLQDIPYMQRGGSWDNSDVKGARKNKWTAADATYDKAGFKESKGLLGKFQREKKEKDIRKLTEKEMYAKLGAVNTGNGRGIRNAPKITDTAPPKRKMFWER